jgi:diguanylate cyclase (GGDEF)-like protein/PAS domain S-box-containing protein
MIALLNRTTPRLAALVAASIVFAVMLVIDASERSQITQSQQVHVMERLSAVRARLESDINVAVAAARSLEAVYTLYPDLSYGDFKVIARELLEPNPAIRNIGLIRGTVVSYVYPLEGNESVVGVDFRNVPEQWSAYQQMMESGTAILAGPVPLVQGGTGAIVRIPVFQQTLRGKEFIGSVTAPLVIDRMLSDAGLRSLEETLVIAIRGSDGKGRDGKVFYGSPEVFGAQPVLQPVTVPGGSWEIAAYPRSGWGGMTATLAMIRLLGGALCLLAAMLAYTFITQLRRRAENERQLNESQAQLKQRSAELMHHNAVLEMINCDAPLPIILEMLVQMVEAHHPEMLCSILLLDLDGKHLRHGAAPSLPDFYNQAVDGLAIGEGVGSCGAAAYCGKRVVVEDIQTHPYWKDLRELAHRADVQSCWSQPISSHDGRVLGAFAIYHHHPAAPQPDQIGLIENYAAMASLAIERSRTSEALRLHDAAFNCIANAMFITDREARIVWINQAFSDLTGYEAAEAIGHPCGELLKSGQQDAQFYAEMWQAVLSGKTWRGELINRRKDGTLYHEETAITPLRDKDNQIAHFVALMQDITTRKVTEEHLKNLAFYDPLTQLPNRRLLIDRLGQTMAASKRSGHYGALMFLDLDNFKPLNDEHGHDVGDLLLMEAARRLVSCVREEDTIARFGGDEFVVLLKELDADKVISTAQASGVAEKIRTALAEPYRLELLQAENGKAAIEHRCTASIGVTLFVNHEFDREDILKWADVAMYQAKAAGRNMIRFYDPGKT